MRKRILVVDDQAANRQIMVDMLSALDYEVESAEDGEGALAMLKLDFDLVMSDVQMPGMDGFELVRKIRETSSSLDLPIIMVTGLASIEDRLRAVEAGANDFIAKPVDMTELKVRTSSQLQIKIQNDEIRRRESELETLVEKRTITLRETLDEMADARRTTYKAYLDTIHRLAVAAEFRDSGTGAHISRVSHYCALLAEKRNLEPHDIEVIRYASPMHDVGKLGTPDGILLKPGSLDPDEWEIMKEHTTFGARILSGSDSELLKAGEVIAHTHHERFDGSGYPQGLAGESIPIMGRICAVADVFDAITTKRPYKEALSNEVACDIIREKMGGHLDPVLIDIFFDNLDEIVAIQQRFRDELNELVV
ncbi:HD domain-containing phosphohydrolase [Gemmatimonadota bacterium]